MNIAKRFSTCLVCGHPLLKNQRVVFENFRPLRHENCSKHSLQPALQKQARALGLTPLDLLTQRLAELQHRIVLALGDMSLEQFHTAETEGYVLLLLPGSDLNVRVVASPYLLPEAIYFENLLTPGELQQQKARLLAQIKEKEPPRVSAGQNKWTWNLLIGYLEKWEEHWNGCKKEEIALQILATERVWLKTLTSAEMDGQLASYPLVTSPSKFKAIAEQILSAPDEAVLSTGIPKARNEDTPAIQS